MISSIHCVNLWKGHVTFIDEGNEVFGKIVDKAEWPLPRFSAVEISGVIFNPGAITHFLYHFKIVFHPLFQTFCFHTLSDGFKIFHLIEKVILNAADCCDTSFLGGHEVVCGIDIDFINGFDAR